MRPLTSLRRTAAITRKEVLHILRDPTTLFFTLFIPVFQLFLLGYAVDMNVRRIRTVVLDRARTQESRTLLDSFVNSDDFVIVGEVYSDSDLSQAIIAGKARVGIEIQEDYSRRLQAGETAQVLVLVDGSEGNVASEAVNVGNAIALRESLQRVMGDRPLPIVARPRVLFNPDTRSANFFIPGLLVILCQIMAVLLTANAVVREKQNGTLEQLSMLPLRAGELIAGKLLPYLVLTFAEFCGIVVLMWVVFAVPIHGSFFMLLALMLPFTLTMLGIGLLISSQASTREAANQMASALMIPTFFLSGYMYPVDSMPLFFRYVSQVIPATWLIDAVRGVILRGAGWAELWRHVLVLASMAMTTLLLSTLRFRKRLF
jgi:ABC-2 type transport system permease protein